MRSASASGSALGRRTSGAPGPTLPPAARGLAVALLAVLGACSHPAPPPARPPPAPTPSGVYHTLLPGETLWRISRSYGVPIETIARANAITDVRRIPAGTRLFIPGGREPGAVFPATEELAHAHATGLAFAWPVKGRLTSRWGGRRGGRHDGIDLSARAGTPVRAAESGRVLYSGSGLSDYGNLIVVRHAGDYATVYAHNRRNHVQRGDLVAKGDVIAEVGRTGNASGPHLHFEVRRRDRPVDPLRYLPRPVELVEQR
jgi:murein DD-endopeptidase MepM/ murein hydrolase activator NlpD